MKSLVPGSVFKQIETKGNMELVEASKLEPMVVIAFSCTFLFHTKCHAGLGVVLFPTFSSVSFALKELSPGIFELFWPRTKLPLN